MERPYILALAAVLITCDLPTDRVTFAADQTATLSGATGDWTDPTLWDSNPLFPHNGNGGFTFDAVIGSGSVTLDQNITIEGLAFSGGTVSGAGTLTLNAASQWTGGELVGPAAGMGQLTLAGTGPLTVSGGGQRFFSGTVTNAGTLVWQEGLIYTGAPDSTFTNSGLIELQGDGSSFNLNHTGTLINAADGTLRRSAGAGIASITLPIDNQGTIDVQSGTLSLSGGGSSSGVFDVAAGATLDLAGGDFSLEEGASGTGAGVVRVIGGTLSVNGATNLLNLELASGTLNVNNAVELIDLRITGGTVSGAGTLTLNAASQWTGGELVGPAAGMGQLTLAGTGPLTVSGGGQKFFSGTVTNAGTLVWQEGLIYTGAPDSTFTNSGLIELQGDGSSFNLNHTGTLINAADGTLRRSAGAGIASITLPIDNQGTIDVQSGTLSLSGGGSSSGVFDVAAGATLDLAGGDFSLEEGASGTGAGVVRVIGGTLSVNGAAHLTNLEYAGGQIFDAAGSLSGNLTWSGGALADGTTLGTDLTATVSGGGQRFFSGTVTNAGTLVWQEGLIYTGAPDSTFTNSGLIELQGDGSSFNLNHTGTLVNAAGGTLRRSTGMGTAFITLPIGNQGTIEVLSGTFALLAGGSSSGVFDVAAGATLDLSGSFSLQDGASSTGAGIVQFASGTLNIDAGAHLANLQFEGGEIADGSTLSGNTLVTGGGQKFFSGTVTNTGTLVWQEGLIYTGAPDSTFTNSGLIDLQGDGSSFTFNHTGTLVNAAGGTLRRSAGAGIASITLPVQNQGIIEVLSGTLDLSGGLANLDATTNTLAGGAYRAIDQGSGATMQVSGGAAAVATIAAGTAVELSGAGAAMFFGGAALSESLVNNAGSLKIYNGHQFIMANALSNTGSVGLGGDGLADAVLTSNGDITNAAGGEMSGHGTINNTVLNSGVVRAAGGTLAIVGGVVDGQTGTIQVDPAATLNLSGAAGASDTGRLIHNGAGLNLGSNHLRVSVDYQNSTFGIGNAFNHRAKVSGTGQLRADPAVSQSLTGNVTGGSTATATLAFGNVHVGTTTTRNYKINNAGASGPSIRGAIQTATGGGNLTDSRLTGSGVTASNFGPLAPGASSGNLAVTFNANSAGTLSGQQVHIANNFDNVATQTLKFSGAAYRLANPTPHAPEPVNFGILHVGDPAPSQALTITNTVANDGFSESLSASIGSPTGDATTNGGSFTALAPGATNSTSLTVGIDTASAGVKSGTATIAFTSSGAGSSGLGLTPLAAQVVNVAGQVNNFAVADVVKVSGNGAFTMTGTNEFSLDLGWIVEGQVGPVTELGIVNTASAPADDLAGSFIVAAPDFSLSGFASFLELAAGGTHSGLLVQLDSTTAGNFTGQITLQPRSINPNPFSIDLDPIMIHLSGQVRLAGDYNNDGMVDAADYTMWRDTLGQAGAGLAADGNGDSAVDQQDYAVWKSNFGATTPPAIMSANAAVPEPSAWLLAAVAAAFVVCHRRTCLKAESQRSY